MRRIAMILTGLALCAGAGVAQDTGTPDRVEVGQASLKVGRSLPVPILVTNDQLIKCFNLGLVTRSLDSGFARFDSAVYVGRMSDGTILNLRIGGPVNNDGNTPDTTVLSAFLAGSEMSALTIGSGEIVHLYFTGLRQGNLELTNAFLPPGGEFVMMPYQGNFNEQLFVPQFSGRSIPIAAGSAFTCGNIDGSLNELVDIADLTSLVDYLFISLAVPAGIIAANVDGSPDNRIDIGDLTYLVSYLFLEGQAPNCP